MPRRMSIALRLRTLAVFTAILCVGPLAMVHGHVPAEAAPDSPRFFDGRAFAAALPVALTPPTLDPDLRLVSMVAADIDADGDLDVVASDGSLNLVVWTNDGTGRLTRKYPEPSSGGLDQRPAQTLERQDATADGVLPPRGSACCVRSEQRLGLAVVGAHLVLPLPARFPAVAGVRTPRAPPASIV
jgi:hypothetical protein